MTRLLAKSTGESLADHTVACIRAAKALLRSSVFEATDRRRIETDLLLSVAFHDLGKAAVGFQAVLRREQRDWEGKRHEALSASLVSSIASVSSATVLSVLTHHKCIPGDGVTSPSEGNLHWEQLYLTDFPASEVWLEMVRQWKANEPLLKREWEEIKAELSPEVQSLINGLKHQFSPLRLAYSWFKRGSGKSAQSRSIPFPERRHAALVRGLTIAADHLGSAHLIPPRIPRLADFQVLKSKPRGFQDRIRHIRGSALLRAPTGSGKTEAALLWAQTNQRKNGRLFYVLPYTASLNAMHKRLGPGFSDEPGIFGTQNVGLLHSNSAAALYFMLASDSDTCSRLDAQKNAKAIAQLAREMWFPIRVCTPHQILRYVLRGHGWESMISEFPNATFIFDEVHAYNPRITGLTLATARLVKSWGAESLFVSATLPDFLAKLIGAALGPLPTVQPVVTDAKDRSVLNRKRHVFQMRPGTLEESLEGVVKEIERNRCTLLVCNHVKTAQRLFLRLENIFGRSARLIHGRFNQKDRTRIEAQLTGRTLPKVVVATQVVEVSLNLDFDQAFSEPAPIDALIQRMGRVNRAGGRPRPAPFVVFEQQVSRHRLYCRCIGSIHHENCRVLRSIAALENLPNPLSEGDLVDAASQVYSVGYDEEERIAFEEGFNHPDLVEFEKNVVAGAYQDWVEQVVDNADGRADVLPVCLVREYEEMRERGLWIEANMLLVPVRFASVRRFVDTSKEPWRIDLPYSPTLGLETSRSRH